MTTTYGELKRQVFLKLQSSDGVTRLAVEQGINEAQKNIARVKDFDELVVLDTTNAFTDINKKSYHIETDLLLVRPKDIYSIRYMDAENSRKLDYVHPREIDDQIPYTEIFGTGRPSWYTVRGLYIELFRIPNAVKPLYISHSQWPSILTQDSDETPYCDLDDVIVALATDIARATVEEGGVTNWSQRARLLLGEATAEETVRPDQTFIAQPFNAKAPPPLGQYWLNPFIKKQP